MDKVEKAIYFATKAHHGQNRKNEEIAMIFHPFTVGMMLQRIGCSDEVVIAGILHDVIEDTHYTKKDIEKEFGREVASLVAGVSESDKSLSWEVRKQETINYIKTASMNEKLIECADKTSNLESILRDLGENGEKAWNKFKRGRKKQKWYHTNVYKGIIENSDAKNPLFKRYGKLIREIFN